MDLSGSMQAGDREGVQALQSAGGVGGLLQVTDHSSPTPAHFFPTFDGNGNVSEYLDTNGAVQAHYEYDAFGNTTVSTGAKAADFTHRFSTKPLDAETGLYYYGYRYYSPELGRWITRDPMEEMGGVSLYIYLDNNVIGDIDYVGFFSLKEFLKERQKQLTEGTYELDIPLGASGLDFVGTLKLEKAQRGGCLKATLSLGVSIGVKKKVMGIVGKTPGVGGILKKAVGKLPDASAQVYLSGNGTICCDCWDFESVSVNVTMTLGNGAHGGNQKSGFDAGVWATGSGTWNTNEGTLSVGGSINWAVNINAKWLAYNADGTIWSGNLVGPAGAQNTLLEIGGPYDSLKLGSNSCGR